VRQRSETRVYEVRRRKDHLGVDLISDALPFGRLWYAEPNAIANAVGYANFYSRSHDAVIRVYDKAGNVIETPEHAGDFKEWCVFTHMILGFPLKITFHDSAFVC
jgi:hypothetical protein